MGHGGIKAACRGYVAIQFTIHILNPIDGVISKVDALIYEYVQNVDIRVHVQNIVKKWGGLEISLANVIRIESL